MLTYLESLMDILNVNPVFGGILGASVFSIFIYSVKSLPSTIFEILKRQLTTSLELHEHGSSWAGLDTQYENFKDWMASREDNIKMSRILTTSGNHREPTLSTGSGIHRFWYKKRLYWFIQRELDSSGSERVKHSITIYTLGRSHKPIYDLFEEFKLLHTADSKSPMGVYQVDTDGRWNRISPVSKRTFDTVFINKHTKSELLDTITTFIENEDKYIKEGVSYRLGLCLEGPTGTGKTSIIKALANQYQRPLYNLPIGRMSETAIVNALIKARGGIVVIEDADNNHNLLKRDSDSIDTKRSELDVIKEVVKNDNSNGPLGLLGGLGEVLNGLDGIVETDDVIIIMTTNDISTLDRALFRPGRIDLVVTVDHLNIEMINDTLDRYYPDDAKEPITLTSISGAHLMKVILDSDTRAKATLKINNM